MNKLPQGRERSLKPARIGKYADDVQAPDPGSTFGRDDLDVLFLEPSVGRGAQLGRELPSSDSVLDRKRYDLTPEPLVALVSS